MEKQATIKHMLDPGVIAIVRATKPVALNELGSAMFDGGIRAIEMTMTTPGAIESLKGVSGKVHENMAIGMGTVMSRDEANAAMDAGARFIVTPVQRLEVVAECNRRNVPVVCGSFSPTEAQVAHEAGADFVKLFPSDLGGPAMVKSLLGPLPHLRIIPTGGITVETCGTFLKAGCVAVAAGSSMLPSDLLEAGDWRRLTEKARKFVAAMAVARGRG